MSRRQASYLSQESATGVDRLPGAAAGWDLGRLARRKIALKYRFVTKEMFFTDVIMRSVKEANQILAV